MGNESPTAVIRSATTNELGLVKATAHLTMERFLDVAVSNNETTSDRKDQILAAVDPVARGDCDESIYQNVEVSSSRIYYPTIKAWNDMEHSITVDLCVYRVVEVKGKVDVHCALAYTKVENASKG